MAGSGAQANREGWYTFVGQHVIQESQPIGSIQPLTVPPTPQGVHVIREWVYGPNVDEVLSMDWDESEDGLTAIGSGDSRYYYAYDSGSNVVGLLSETGHLVEGYAYQPYGQPTILVPGGGATDATWAGTAGTDVVSTGTYGGSTTPAPYSPSGNLWFFTGRQYDPEIGSYNYRARQYHPTLGQFMSLDPIGAWGDPMNLGNPYAYVGNNPSSFRDPSGHYAGVDDAIACGGGALVAAGIRGAMDLWKGKASSWQSYTGEVAGGCAGGVATLYAGPIGGGAAYGAVSSSTRYGLEAASGDRDGSLGGFSKTVGIETATGAAGGALAFGGGKLASAGLSRGGPAMQRFAGVIDDGLHAQKGPLAGRPGNRGFTEMSGKASMLPGAHVDRYGGEAGFFLSPAGTPFSMRSLPGMSQTRSVASYEVLKSFEVTAGKVRPWYGQPGGGIQFDTLPASVRELVEGGFLRRL